jgi:hypothetical protein
LLCAAPATGRSYDDVKPARYAEPALSMASASAASVEEPPSSVRYENTGSMISGSVRS